MADFASNQASNQGCAFPALNPVRPTAIRRVLSLVLRVKPALIGTWQSYQLRQRRAAERAELRHAGFQIWHDLGASRVVEEIGKPSSHE